MDARTLFGGMQYVPGLGYVEGGTPAPRPLGDDGSVMMISGLGTTVNPPGVVGGNQSGFSPDNPNQWIQGSRLPPVGQSYSGASTPPVGGLQQPITIFSVTLPLWAWLAIAAVLGGTGGYYLRGRLR